MDTPSSSVAWQPKFVLDLSTARAKAFEELTTQFEQWRTTNPPVGPVPLTDGWHTITPQMAEDLLRRNPLGANRKANLPTIVYYAMQMKRGEWPKTGQSLIFGINGQLLDGQHRLWACLLSGVPFVTFVVTNVPDHPQLFAYIDNGKVRSAANALQTAGMNGVASLVVTVLDMAYNYENGLFLASGSTKSHPRLSPVQYLQMLDDNPNARDGARLAVSDYEPASNLIDKGIVAFATKHLLDHYGDDTVERFFNEIGGVETVEETSPILPFRKIMQDDAKKLDNQMKKPLKLGNLILCFNAWISGETLKKRWALQAHEDFPSFATPAAGGEDMPEAAE
jgi:hypothetical protein